MTDIVERLRARAAAETGDETVFLTAIPNYMLHREAAAEIERLRAALDATIRAGNELAGWHRTDKIVSSREEAHEDWRKARDAARKALRGET